MEQGLDREKSGSITKGDREGKGKAQEKMWFRKSSLGNWKPMRWDIWGWAKLENMNETESL
jgi:hypothetical protein